MTLDEAQTILADRGVMESRDGTLWNHRMDGQEKIVDRQTQLVFVRGCDPYVRGAWTPDQLEALAVWMRAHAK